MLSRYFMSTRLPGNCSVLTVELTEGGHYLGLCYISGLFVVSGPHLTLFCREQSCFKGKTLQITYYCISLLWPLQNGRIFPLTLVRWLVVLDCWVTVLNCDVLKFKVKKVVWKRTVVWILWSVVTYAQWWLMVEVSTHYDRVQHMWWTSDSCQSQNKINLLAQTYLWVTIFLY